MIVVDTSVIAYLFFAGERTPQASAVLEKDPEWAAPLVWRSEFRSVASHYLRQGHLSLTTAQRFVAEAESLMEGREYPVESARVLELTARSGCNAYTCEFVHLAQKLGVLLVTADLQALNAFRGTAVTPESFVA